MRLALWPVEWTATWAPPALWRRSLDPRSQCLGTPGPVHLLPLETLPPAWFCFPLCEWALESLAHRAQAWGPGILSCGHCPSSPWGIPRPGTVRVQNRDAHGASPSLAMRASPGVLGESSSLIGSHHPGEAANLKPSKATAPPTSTAPRNPGRHRTERSYRQRCMGKRGTRQAEVGDALKGTRRERESQPAGLKFRTFCSSKDSAIGTPRKGTQMGSPLVSFNCV